MARIEAKNFSKNIDCPKWASGVVERMKKQREVTRRNLEFSIQELEQKEKTLERKQARDKKRREIVH